MSTDFPFNFTVFLTLLLLLLLLLQGTLVSVLESTDRTQAPEALIYCTGTIKNISLDGL